MGLTLDFFVRELARLRKNSMRIKRSLDPYDLDDPRIAGQVALFEQQLANYRLVLDLAAHATSPADALVEIRVRYMRALRQHWRHTLNSPPERALRSDRWWRALSHKQYLGYLNRRFNAWLASHTQEEIRQDMKKADSEEAAAKRQSVLSAMARAYRSSLAREYLARDDFERQEVGRVSPPAEEVVEDIVEEDSAATARGAPEG